MGHRPAGDGRRLMTTAGLAAARADAIAAQQHVIAADPPFAVLACPGAGKTRVIVERHLTRPVPARQGRAITAFTRVAASEVNRRCAEAGRLDLTGHPHFIGTLDTFIWLHLVRPFLPADRTWYRLESWRDAPARAAEFTCGQTYHLTDADFSYDPIARRWHVRPVGTARRVAPPEDWASRAHDTRVRLERAGYLTGAELRAHACRNLAAKPGMLLAVLTAKYSELVVDEAQDCSAADVHILSQLHEAGLPLVLVADPDQAIYGFRGSAAADLAGLAGRIGRHDLTHNWRSTAIICAAAATLRGDPARRVPDTAVAGHHNVRHPILLYATEARDAATADFLAYAATIGISPGDCMVLAHARSSLPRTYVGAPAPPGRKAAAALAWAVGILTEYLAADTRAAARARDIIARTVLRWWYHDADHLTAAETLVAHDLDPAEFYRLVHRIVAAMPPLDQPMSTWVPGAAAVLGQHPPAVGAARTRTRLSTAGLAGRRARSVAGLPTAAGADHRPRLSSIHQVKGDQAEAVLLHLPTGPETDRALSAWLTDPAATADAAEALRVLYVGLTRARRLLGIAVPELHRCALQTQLQSRCIPALLRHSPS